MRRNHRWVEPTMAHGTTGTPEVTAKAAAPSSNGSSSVSRKPMRPSAKMPSTPSASKTRRTARTAEVSVVLAGLYGIMPPTKAITRFLKPRLKSASFGPNQVMRGSIGTTAITSIGSKPLWWFATSWKGGAGQCSSPDARTSKSVRTRARFSPHASRHRSVTATESSRGPVRRTRSSAARAIAVSRPRPARVASRARGGEDRPGSGRRRRGAGMRPRPSSRPAGQARARSARTHPA